MKAHPCFLTGIAGLLLAAALVPTVSRAQNTVPTAESAAVSSNMVVTSLEELVAPIALYPDALIALILPAATTSSDVVLAARFLSRGGSAAQIESQPWDDSVKGLAHYPEVVKWMDENLSWTQRLGEAYLEKPEAVMAAVQRARTQARSNGVLIDTPQQQVVVDGGYIRIVPAQPDVIYVPRYDPEIVYIDRPVYAYPDPWITFGMGFGVGSWLAYDLDWHRSAIWHDRRHDRWSHYRDWRYRSHHGHPGFVTRDPWWSPWRPLPGRPRPPHREGHRWSHDSDRLSHLPGTPRFDRDRWREHADRAPGRDHSDGERQRRYGNGDSRRDTNRPANGNVRRDRPNENITVNPSVPNAGRADRVAPPSAIEGARDRFRGAIDRQNRQPGLTRPPERREGGTVSTVPSIRRPQPEGNDASQPARHDSARPPGERMRQMRENGAQVNRPAQVSRPMPSVSAQTVSPSVSAPPPAAVARPMHQHREFRQPDRVARPAPAPAPEHASAARVAPEPARTYQAPAPQADHSDRGSRASVGGGGRGDGRGHRERTP